MNENMNRNHPHLDAVHLTDEQFADLLLGATPAPVQQHLVSCPECSTEAERVAAAIGSFEHESRLWAERRAASQPALAAQQSLSSSWLGIARPQAWVAAALAVAVGIAAAISTRHRQSQQTAAVVQQTPQIAAQPAASNVMEAQQITSVAAPESTTTFRAAHVTPARLKADNQLLSAIDGELRADSSPANLFGLDVTSRSLRTSASAGVSN